jgi:tripartite-type tricarboxylate transporter receptor subunit TctC
MHCHRPLRTLTFAASLLACAAAGAQSYPSKPIHVVVPFTAGSTTDIIARAITDRLAASLGQPIVVDNKPGAGGTLGAAAVAKAEPDGHTILVHSSSHTVNPATYDNLTFDTERDFAGVMPLASLPNVLVVPPAKGYKTVKDLVDAAKAKPGTLNYASAGAGSATHLNAEKFRIAAGFEAVHIPFKGSPEAISELIGGRVDYYFSPVAPVTQLIKENKLTPLAVSSAKRSSVLPDVPTTAEAGVAGSEYNFWIGMLVPAKTPRPIVERLYRDTQAALASPEVKERFAKVGAEPMPMTPQQFDALVKDEIAANKVLVKSANITIR